MLTSVKTSDLYLFSSTPTYTRLSSQIQPIKDHIHILTSTDIQLPYGRVSKLFKCHSRKKKEKKVTTNVSNQSFATEPATCDGLPSESLDVWLSLAQQLIISTDRSRNLNLLRTGASVQPTWTSHYCASCFLSHFGPTFVLNGAS